MFHSDELEIEASFSTCLYGAGQEFDKFLNGQILYLYHLFKRNRPPGGAVSGFQVTSTGIIEGFLWV